MSSPFSPDRVWDNEELARAFDTVVAANPTHQGIFKMVGERLRELGVSLIADVGGATGSFAQHLRKNGIETPVVIIDPAKEGTIRVAQSKGISHLTIVPSSFSGYTIQRNASDRVAVVGTYSLHNLRVEVREDFFRWLSENLEKGEHCVIGDTIADDVVPDRHEIGVFGSVEKTSPRKEAFRLRLSRAEEFLKAVGYEHWRDLQSVDSGLRDQIRRHTVEDDPMTAPDMPEYNRLCKEYGFSMNVRWKEGYLHVVDFAKI